VTTTTEAPTRPAPKGPTKLQNVRVPPELWTAAGAACDRLGTDRSKVVRDALQALVDRADDPQWAALSTLAEERGTTADEIQNLAVTQYLATIERKRSRRKPPTPAT
jgi:hypothetical protein